jgi:hypothetical protein
MFDWLGGLFRKLLILLLVLLAAYAGWLWGPKVFPRIHDRLGLGGTEPEAIVSSPELADSVLAEVQQFRRGEGPDQLTLDANKLTSVARYSIPELMPAGMVDPEIRLRDERVHIRSRIVLEAFPELPDLGPILGILPDTLDVAVQASVMPFGE